MITVCHLDRERIIPNKNGLNYMDFKFGSFMSKYKGNVTAETLFDEATNHHYNLLDYTGNEFLYAIESHTGV